MGSILPKDSPWVHDDGAGERSRRLAHHAIISRRFWDLVSVKVLEETTPPSGYSRFGVGRS